MLGAILTTIHVHGSFTSTRVLPGLHYCPTRRLTGFRDNIFGVRSCLEWPKARALPTPGAGEERSAWSSLWWGCGMHSHCARQVGTSYRTRHAFTMGPSMCVPWRLPKGVKNLCPHETQHMDVNSSFIHHRRDFRQPRRPSEGDG